MKAGLKVHLLTHPLVYMEDHFPEAKFSSQGQNHFPSPALLVLLTSCRWSGEPQGLRN